MIKKNNYQLNELTSFKQEGLSKTHLYFNTLNDLRSFIMTKQLFIILGKGSNSIVNPDSRTSTIIQLSPDLFPSEIFENKITVSAGTSVNKLMTVCQKAGLSGLEFCAGVPATVGGMITMNFGCWGSSISDVVERVHILKEDGTDLWLSQEELKFGYRNSAIHDQQWIVLEAQFNCEQKTPEQVKKTIQNNIQERLSKQPLREPTFGSIFKNPEGDFAARLIEETGLKGYIHKNLQLSEKHANFMVNLGQATFQDIIDFIAFIKDKVKQKTGIQLECEVQIFS